MATNSGRGNPIAAKEGPSKAGEGAPPPLSQDVKDAVKAAGGADGAGLHISGQETPTPTVPAVDTSMPPASAQPGAALDPSQAQGTSETKVKSEKELAREQRKADKAAKFAQKKEKTQTQAGSTSTAAPSKSKKVKGPPEPQEQGYVEDTPAGEKKRLKSLEDPLFKAYNPVAVESAWYEWWEKEGFFKPQFKEDGSVKDEGSFVIVIPPPNVTGALHMGHALGNSLQDVMIRWNRMLGKTTLWLPGCDHAGISTQMVVENMLWRRQGKTRHDLGRKKFVETVWEWKEDYHKRINNAQRKMGGSTDWSREAFTMDQNLTAAVTETFVKLHEEGIIYRANRLVNWCTHLNTALSNLEVVNKELKGSTKIEVPGYDKKIEFGIIVHFKYQVDGSDETIEVATTRPETMLGDTGVAVHPDDARYKHLVGKKAVHPFIQGRLMPIVADESVEQNFGTGAVKITPAHDHNDFALGQRHNLAFINILTDDGLMNENAGPYKGQRRFDVRYTIQEDLKKAGLYVTKKDNPMTAPFCDKSKDIIEPIMKPQWYMKMKDMATEAVAVVRQGKIKIQPETAEKSYYTWLADVHDWCLSRQLWWGHQCPVYFADIEGESGDEADNQLWFSGRSEEEARAKAETALPGKKFSLRRDEDVLDTWFSSGLWPFSTLGWPNKSSDLEKLYPTSVLETGWDILFFWIARMVMLGLKMVGDVPFREVYCHSLVRDSDGRKMSKSLGNVIDPLDVISGIELEKLHDKLIQGNLHPTEVDKAKKYQKVAFPDGIPQCGADALRFTMVNYSTGGGDIHFDVKVMHGYRRFCNKIYQATKFVLGNLNKGVDFVPRKTSQLSGKESLAEKWILHKFNVAARDINQALGAREFNKATSAVYHYWLNQLCDVFIENSKAIFQSGAAEEKRSAMDTLYSALESALRLMHPFMPYLTEELWQRLPRRPGDQTRSIMLAKFPVYDAELDDAAADAAYELVLGCSKGIRSLMGEYTLKHGAQVFLQAYDETAHKTIAEQVLSIKSLSGKGISCIDVLSLSDARPAGCVVYPVSSATSVFLYVKNQVDMDNEIGKANKKLEKIRAAIEKQKTAISKDGYLKEASAETQEADRQQLTDLEAEAKGFEGTIEQFKALKLE